MATILELDRLYGALRQPKYVDALEGNTPPLSRFRLLQPDQFLTTFLHMAFEPHPVDHLLYQAVFFLWLVNEIGDIIIAYEEMFPTAGSYRAPRQRECPVPAGGRRLGHPALVNGGPGRIGGELLFDDGNRRWVLMNKSGRYGVGPDRSEQHLRNVARRFEESGMQIAVHYLRGGA
jgi:hypothetical protein